MITEERQKDSTEDRTEQLPCKARTEVGILLQEQTGMSLRLFLLLAVTILAVILVFVIPGYQHHVENGRMTMDIQSVQTMEDVASITYLQDGASGFTRYYYDELTHTCLPEEKRSTIEGYGRSYARQNENAETGAVGIPNLADTLSGLHDGSQILTVAFDSDRMIAKRWTSNTWSYYDWYYMTDTERDHVTRAQRLAIDEDTVLRAKTASVNEYKKDYAKLLGKGTYPGLAVYDYDPLTDSVRMDEPVYEKLCSGGTVLAENPKHLSIANRKDYAGYGVSTDGTGTGAYVASEDRYQEAAALIPAMGEEAVTDAAADGSENAMLQVFVTAADPDTSSDSKGSDVIESDVIAVALWVKGNGYDPEKESTQDTAAAAGTADTADNAVSESTEEAAGN